MAENEEQTDYEDPVDGEDEADCFPYPNFPPLRPEVRPVMLDKETVAQDWPIFYRQIESLKQRLEALEGVPETLGFTASRTEISNGFAETHIEDILVVALPEKFSAHIATMAVQTPEVINWSSLDELEMATLHRWSVKLDDGDWYHICVPEFVLYHVASNNQLDNGRRECLVPVVFIAGQHIACGAFWYDSDYEDSSQCAALGSGVNYRPYQVCGESEIEQAMEETQRVGSPTPWRNGFWDIGNGEKMVEVPFLLSSAVR